MRARVIITATGQIRGRSGTSAVLSVAVTVMGAVTLMGLFAASAMRVAQAWRVEEWHRTLLRPHSPTVAKVLWHYSPTTLQCYRIGAVAQSHIALHSYKICTVLQPYNPPILQSYGPTTSAQPTQPLLLLMGP